MEGGKKKVESWEKGGIAAPRVKPAKKGKKKSNPVSQKVRKKKGHFKGKKNNCTSTESQEVSGLKLKKEPKKRRSDKVYYPNRPGVAGSFCGKKGNGELREWERK